MALQNVFGNLALDASVTALGTRLDNILTELNQKLEAGQEVALNAATLSALEQITATIGNWPSDFPDAATLAKLEQIRVLLAGTVAVSAVSLPLPTGAATAAAQATGNASLANIDAEVTSIDNKIPAQVGGRLPVDVQFPATQPVSAASLPLPTGAATETTLAALNAKIPAAGQTIMSASQPVAIASDQSPVNIVEPAITITGQAAQTAIVNNILSTTAGAAGTDVTNYRSMTVQVISTGTGGTFIFEQSNTGGAAANEWRPLPVFNAELTTGAAITTAITASASQIMYTFPVRGRFVRLRIVSAITGGSIQAFSRISTEPWTPAAQLVASNTAGNLLAQVSGTVTANIGTGSIAAGTNAIGDVGVQYRANATGAASRSHVISAATTNPTIVKASAGRLLGWNISNTNAAYRYVKFHNQTTSPTAGTGVVQTVGVPPNSNVNFHAEGGIAFTTGIAMTTVTGAADADTTAVGLNDLVIDVFFA